MQDQNDVLVRTLTEIAGRQAEQLTAARGWQSRLLIAIFSLIALSVGQRLGPIPASVVLAGDVFAVVSVLVDFILRIFGDAYAHRQLSSSVTLVPMPVTIKVEPPPRRRFGDNDPTIIEVPLHG